MSESDSAHGTPDPARIETEHALTLDVECSPRVDVGPGPYGDRRVIPITGGSFAGPRLRGEIVSGGADWQLARVDGVFEIEARYTLRAEDGAYISIRNAGILRGDDDGSASGGYVRSVVQFEAPREGQHAWLNRSIFLGTLALRSGPAPVNVRVHVYRVI